MTASTNREVAPNWEVSIKDPAFNLGVLLYRKKATPDLNKIDVALKSFTALQYGEPAADHNLKKMKDGFAPPSAKVLDRLIKLAMERYLNQQGERHVTHYGARLQRLRTLCLEGQRIAINALVFLADLPGVGRPIGAHKHVMRSNIWPTHPQNKFSISPLLFPSPLTTNQTHIAPSLPLPCHNQLNNPIKQSRITSNGGTTTTATTTPTSAEHCQHTSCHERNDS